MKRILSSLTFLLVSTTLLFAQKTEQCPLTVTDIENVFGKGFKAQESSKIGDVLLCSFSSKDYSVQIKINSAYGMKIDDYNKMMSPNTVTWKPVPNDLDGARIEIRDEKKDDLARMPAITYIRKDNYVRLQVLGNFYGYDNSKLPRMLEEMRDKLTKVKRVPN
jgi:hypothetical protein